MFFILLLLLGVYSTDPSQLESDLAIATEGFLDQSVSFDVASKTISLSMLFSWYRLDFGSTDQEVLEWIKNNGSNELKAKFENFYETISESVENIQEPRFGNVKIKISYDEYIWDLND